MKHIEGVRPDEFLELEAEARAAARHPPGPGAVRKFRAVVRSMGRAWLDRPQHRLSATRGHDGCTLHFELLDGRRWVSAFTLNVHNEDGLYTLKGPNAERKRLGLSPKLLAALDELAFDWQMRPEAEGLGRADTTVYLHTWTAAQAGRFAAAAIRLLAPLHPLPGKTPKAPKPTRGKSESPRRKPAARPVRLARSAKRATISATRIRKPKRGAARRTGR